MSQPTNTVKVILEVIHEQQNNLACVLMTGRGKVWSKSVELFLLSCTISTFTILQILPSGGRSNVYHSLNRSAFFSAISSNSSSSRISFSLYERRTTSHQNASRGTNCVTHPIPGDTTAGKGIFFLLQRSSAYIEYRIDNQPEV